MIIILCLVAGIVAMGALITKYQKVEFKTLNKIEKLLERWVLINE